MNDVSFLRELGRTCGYALARGVAGESCADFERFGSGVPAADQLIVWCPEVYEWMATQPVDVENDRDGLLALALVGAFVSLLVGTSRDDFVQAFWCAYSEATGHDAVCNGPDHLMIA